MDRTIAIDRRFSENETRIEQEQHFRKQIQLFSSQPCS